MCSQYFNKQQISIGSDNGLVPNRRQAIIWTNDCLVYWRIYASLGLNDICSIDDMQNDPWYHVFVNSFVLIAALLFISFFHWRCLDCF